jgi:DNA-binding CsgD family transcriptional regulator
LENINKSLGEFAKSTHFIDASNDNYWIFKDGECMLVAMDENNVYEKEYITFNDLGEYLIPGHENIFELDSIFTFILLDNGFAIYNKNWTDREPGYSPEIILKQFEFYNVKGDKMPPAINYNKIPYRFNHLNISVSYPDYINDSGFEYRLEGHFENWILIDKQEDIEFQNLPYGRYRFIIRPQSGGSNEQYAMDFTINPPWIKSTSAQLIYLIFALVIIGLSVYLIRRKISNIHKNYELERKRLLEKEAVENEKKLMVLRNENLRNEIKLRNNRLAKSTFSLIQKNNTLISVKEELKKIKKELGVRFPAKYFKRIVRKIDTDISSERDWRIFEESFSEVHEKFLHKLKEQYPDLTPADIQLCAYLKMNLSSKEIASLLNITVRGVEIRRYRLRKKLCLEHETNLVEFIMEY